MSGAVVFSSYVEKLKGKKVEMKGDRVDILREHPLAYDLSSEPLRDELPWQKTEEFVPVMFELWNELKEKMLPRFQTR
ncbi:hypothetical protein AAZF84_25970, partial [Bacillus sp. JR_15]